jgi:hypothetical protein
MKKINYHSSVSAKVSPKEAYANIADVSGWWAKNFKGKAVQNGDKFRVTFGDTWVDFEVTNAEPDKTITWNVTDCNLHWIHNKKEWNGTKVLWEISSQNEATKIDMTHIGLVPGVECYNDCEAGWNEHVTRSLQQLFDSGKGMPQ